jgi:hypothetical protein
MLNPLSAFNDGTHLIVSDNGNSRILIWNTVPKTNDVLPDLVLGQKGDFSTRTAGNDATSGSTNYYLNNPWGVFSDGTHLFVADRNNNRVLVWTTFPTSSTQGPTFAIGQANLTANSSGATATTLNNPLDVWGDGTNLYVSDFNNFRVMVYNYATLLSSATNGQPASFALGTNTETTGGPNTYGASTFKP